MTDSIAAETPPQHSPRSAALTRQQQLVRGASLIVVLVGVLVLVGGWGLGIPWLKSIHPDGATMKANTALCFILTGISLGLQVRPQLGHTPAGQRRRGGLQLLTQIARAQIARICALVVLTIGALTLSQYLFGWNLGIDQLLVRDTINAPDTQYPGRMGDNTALNFILTGLALGLKGQRRQRSSQIAQSATLMAGAIALLAVLGYAYGVEVFYRFIFYSNSMSLRTALTFLVLCGGILLLQGERSWLRVLQGNELGTILVHRVLLLVVALPAVLGWLVLLGLQARLYNPAFALALLVIALIFSLSLLLWQAALCLNQLDRERLLANEKTQASEERLQLALNSASMGHWEFDLRSRRGIWSPEAKQLLGLPPDWQDATYEVLRTRVHPNDRELLDRALAQSMETGNYQAEFRVIWPDGSIHWLADRGRVHYDGAGVPLRALGVVNEMTAGKVAELNDQFLHQLDLRLRALTDPEAMEWEAIHSLGSYLQVSRCSWHQIDQTANIAIVKQHWAQGGLPAFDGTYPLADYCSPELLANFRQGKPWIVTNVSSDPETASFADNYLALGTHSFVSVPCIFRGEWVAVLGVYCQTIRTWRDDEVKLLQETVARLSALIAETRTVQTLREQEEQTRLATEAAELGMWFWDLRRQELVWTERCKALFGLAPETQISYAIFLDTLHPEDRERTHAAVSRALEEQSEYNIEYRTLWPDGSQHWIAAKGRGVYDPSTHKPIRMIGTVQDITLRKQAELALQQQTQELGRLNQLKDEFLAVLSHELRTPLNPILGWVKILKARPFNPEQATRALDAIQNGAEHQLALISDLLDVSSIIQGKLCLERQPIDLVQVLKTGLEIVSFAAQSKNITITQTGLTALPSTGDSQRLQQVFWNLINNAIKFTPEGGRVEVCLKQEAGLAVITVSDTGIGIPSDFLPHVFKDFRQADSSSTRRYGGLGLGLAIVRRLVELHGGTVTAASHGPGQGATFTVQLPLVNPAPEALPPLQTVPQQHKIVSDRLPTPRADTARLQGIQILLVEDNPDNLDLQRCILEYEGAVVSATTSPIQALTLFATHLPDVIISDIEMPELNGYEFISRLRALPQGENIPALAVSAYAQDDDRQLALALGFQAYLAKPVDPMQLVATVYQLVSPKPAIANPAPTTHPTR